VAREEVGISRQEAEVLKKEAGVARQEAEVLKKEVGVARHEAGAAKSECRVMEAEKNAALAAVADATMRQSDNKVVSEEEKVAKAAETAARIEAAVAAAKIAESQR
jgi:hypothetical protein